MASAQVKEMLAAAVAACEDKKAEDIRILSLDPTESGLTDYFLICNGTNERQNSAITDEIEMRLKKDFGTYPNSVEGRRQGEWILMDYVDFIVHVFSAEKRAFYGLERLRKSATSISISELNDDIKAAITAKRTKKPATSSSAKAATKGASTRELAEGASKASAKAAKAPAKKASVKKTATKKTSTKTAAKASKPAVKKAAK